MNFSIKDVFNKCDQIRRKLKKSLMENFIFCAVYVTEVLAYFSGMLPLSWSHNRYTNFIFIGIIIDHVTNEFHEQLFTCVL